MLDPSDVTIYTKYVEDPYLGTVIYYACTPFPATGAYDTFPVLRGVRGGFALVSNGWTTIQDYYPLFFDEQMALSWLVEQYINHVLSQRTKWCTLFNELDGPVTSP